MNGGTTLHFIFRMGTIRESQQQCANHIPIKSCPTDKGNVGYIAIGVIDFFSAAIRPVGTPSSDKVESHDIRRTIGDQSIINESQLYTLTELDQCIHEIDR